MAAPMIFWAVQSCWRAAEKIRRARKNQGPFVWHVWHVLQAFLRARLRSDVADKQTDEAEQGCRAEQVKCGLLCGFV